MGQQRKIRVGVIFGGRSGEHDVSLRSARAVMGALEALGGELACRRIGAMKWARLLPLSMR